MTILEVWTWGLLVGVVVGVLICIGTLPSVHDAFKADSAWEPLALAHFKKYAPAVIFMALLWPWIAVLVLYIVLTRGAVTAWRLFFPRRAKTTADAPLEKGPYR